MAFEPRTESDPIGPDAYLSGVAPLVGIYSLGAFQLLRTLLSGVLLPLRVYLSGVMLSLGAHMSGLYVAVQDLSTNECVRN
jgi:hypothetical protein